MIKRTVIAPCRCSANNHQAGYGVSVSRFGTGAPFNLQFIHEYCDIVTGICQLMTRRNRPNSDCPGLVASVQCPFLAKEGPLIL